jgi:predicted PurR-regulated permease PerM
MAQIEKSGSIPTMVKLSVYTLGFVAFFYVLILGQTIIVPLIFGWIIAVLISPVVNFLVRIKLNRILAIAITIILALISIAGLSLAIINQIGMLSDSWPQLIERASGLVNQSIQQVAANLDMQPQKIHRWLTDTQKELMNFDSSVLGNTLLSVGSGIAMFFLIPVYTFLFLVYQPILMKFLYTLSGKTNNAHMHDVISQTKRLVQQYLVGLIIETAIVAILNIMVLLLLGIPYAVLLGTVAALLNLIPYLGGIVGVAIPMAVALATQTSGWFAIYVLIGFYIIQLIDNNYIVPKIVASKVKINALFSIVVVLVGNAIWGIPGMFLSIPLLAIVKLTCDNVERLNPWGALLGEKQKTKV